MGERNGLGRSHVPAHRGVRRRHRDPGHGERDRRRPCERAVDAGDRQRVGAGRRARRRRDRERRRCCRRIRAERSGGARGQSTDAERDVAGEAPARRDRHVVAGRTAQQRRLTRGGRGDGEAARRAPGDESIQDVGRRLLDSGVDEVGLCVVVQRPGPAHRPGREHPGAARGLVDGGVGIVPGERRARQQRVCAGGGTRPRILAEEAVRPPSDDSRHRVAVLEPGSGVHPVLAVVHDVGRPLGDRRPRDRAGELHANQRLFRTVQQRIAPEDRLQRRVGDRVDAGVLIGDEDAVGNVGARRLEPRLPVHGVSAEEAEVDAGIACGEDVVVHLFRVVRVVSHRQEAAMRQEPLAVRVRVDVGRVGYVVPFLLQPAHEFNLVGHEVVAVAVVRVRTIERHLRRGGAASHRVRTVALVVVEALASQTVVRIVVVRLIRGDRLLVEQIGHAVVVANGEHGVVAVALGIRQEGEIDSGRPRVLRRQRVGRRPAALDQSGRGVRRTGCLPDAAEGAGVGHQASAQALIPADPVDVDGVGLRRVDAHVERDVPALVDADGRRIALDLLGGVVRGTAPRDLPVRRPGLEVLDHDRVVRGGGHRRE